MKNRSFHQHGSFVVSCREPFGNFPAETSTQFPPKWEGNFPKPVNLSIHNRSDIKTSLGFFSQLGLFVWLFMTLWNFERNIREISMRKYLWWFSREKREKYPHRKFSFVSPEFLLGNYEEISMGMIPWNSTIIPCGNLGDVVGLPAGIPECSEICLIGFLPTGLSIVWG